MALLAAVFTTCLAINSAARADDWRPVSQSCVSGIAIGSCVNEGAKGNGLWNLVVAPGGKTAYASAWDANALLIFDRNTTTGSLTLKGCVKEGAAVSGCAAARGLIEPDGIAIGNDGRSLYVAGWGGALAVFKREPTTGALTQNDDTTGCFSEDGSDAGVAGRCTPARGFGGEVTDLILTPDQKSLYVASLGAIAEFDITNGVLTQKPGTAGCVGGQPADQCATGVALGFQRQLALSPDTKNLYAPNATSHGILIFDRDATTGALTQKPGHEGCITVDGTGKQCSTDPRLAGQDVAVTVSADGKEVYTPTSGGIVTWARTENGGLTFKACVNDLGTLGCRAGRGVTNLGYVAISPDGQDLIAVKDSGLQDGMIAFARNASTGVLTPRPGPDGCVTPTGSIVDNGVTVPGACRANPAAGNDGRVVFAGNGQFYAGFFSRSSIVAFKRDFYPTCANRAVSVPHNTAAAVPLVCSDRNGDPIGALQITQVPRLGQLGAVDVAKRRVFYNPFNGVAGGDSFKYRGIAASLASAPATVSLRVAPAPPAPRPAPRGGGLIDQDHDGFFSNQDCNDNNPGIRPNQREVPGNNVDENCDGLAAPFPKVDAGVSWAADNNPAQPARFTLTQLLVKGVSRAMTVSVRCSGKPKCRFTSKRVASPRRGKVDLLKKLSRRQRVLRAGQTIEVRITRSGFVGKVLQVRFREGKKPLQRNRCLLPGTSRPRSSCR